MNLRQILPFFCVFLWAFYLKAETAHLECENPTLARKEVCDTWKEAEQALKNKNHKKAREKIEFLKENIKVSDPLASEILKLEEELKAQTTGLSPFLKSKEYEVQKYEFRDSDDFRVRTGTEIFSLYSIAVAHGIYTGLFAVSFQNKNNDDNNATLSSFGLGGLLGTGASVGAVLLLDRPEKMRYGVPTAIASFYGSGLFLGLFSAMAIDLNKKDRTEIDGDQYIQFIWGGATLGAVAGGAIAYAKELRPGQSLFIASSTNAGGWTGFGLANTFQDINVDSLQGVHANSALIGSLAGLAGSSFAVGAFGFNPSVAQVQYTNLAGFAGVLTGLFLGFATTADDAQTYAGLITFGGLTGTGLGAWLTSDMALDTSPLRRQEKSWLNQLNFALAPVKDGLSGQVSFSW